MKSIDMMKIEDNEDWKMMKGLTRRRLENRPRCTAQNTLDKMMQEHMMKHLNDNEELKRDEHGRETISTRPYPVDYVLGGGDRMRQMVVMRWLVEITEIKMYFNDK